MCVYIQVASEGVFECVLRPGAGRLAPSDGPFAGSCAGGEIRPDAAQWRDHLPCRRSQRLSRPAILLRLSLTLAVVEQHQYYINQNIITGSFSLLIPPSSPSSFRTHGGM